MTLLDYLGGHHPLHESETVWPFAAGVFSQPAGELLLHDSVAAFHRPLTDNSTLSKEK